MPGQPALPGIWRFDLATVSAQEVGGIAPSLIINKPNGFTLSETLTNQDFLSTLLVGAPGVIHFHAQNMETNAVVTLPPVPFTKVAGVSQVVVSPTYSTAGGVGALDVGTWMIIAHVHFPGTIFAPVVAGFNQILLQVI